MIDKSKYQQVDYNPVPVMVNHYIESLNNQAGALPAKDMAGMLASTVAAVAYVMSQSNDADTIKALFCSLVDEAHKRFTEREKLIEKAKKKSPIIGLN